MRVYRHENAKAIREYIASHWRDETDDTMAKRFGVSRQYIMTARKRMGLRKNLLLLSEIRAMRPRNVKHFMRTKRYKLLPEWQRIEYRQTIRANGEKPL